MESFITKYKGSVENNNLPRFGKISISTLTDNVATITIYADSSDYVEISSDGSISSVYVPGSQTTVSLPYKFKTASGFNTKTLQVQTIGNLYVGDKYNSAFWGISADNINLVLCKSSLKDFLIKYNNQISTQNFCLENLSGLYGDLADLNELNEATIIDVSHTDVSGNISSFNPTTNLTQLDISDCPGITGYCTDLGKFRNLSILNFIRTKITGSIELMIESMVNSGTTTRDTSNPLFSNGILNNLTFGGIIQPYTRSFGNITWNGTSKIIIYCGDRNLINCNVIYAKGASQQEISSWEQAGKEVHVIS